MKKTKRKDEATRVHIWLELMLRRFTVDTSSCAGWYIYTVLWLSLILCGCMPVCVYLCGKASEPFSKQTQMATKEIQHACAKSLKARWAQTPCCTHNPFYCKNALIFGDIKQTEISIGANLSAVASCEVSSLLLLLPVAVVSWTCRAVGTWGRHQPAGPGCRCWRAWWPYWTRNCCKSLQLSGTAAEKEVKNCDVTCLLIDNLLYFASSAGWKVFRTVSWFAHVSPKT